MYIDYSNLWKLLIDKGMTKSDLIELTGISTRVLAKLSKNEIVTTDTIARICTALNCDVGDIMECVSESRLSVYTSFKRFGKPDGEYGEFRIIRFSLNGQSYKVYESKHSANGGVTLRCGRNGSIIWEEANKAGHIRCAPNVTFMGNPSREANEIVIVLIKGKPGCICGLDENGFVSSRNTLKNETDIYVMSAAAFKTFEMNGGVRYD